MAKSVVQAGLVAMRTGALVIMDYLRSAAFGVHMRFTLVGMGRSPFVNLAKRLPGQDLYEA